MILFTFQRPIHGIFHLLSGSCVSRLSSHNHSLMLMVHCQIDTVYYVDTVTSASSNTQNDLKGYRKIVILVNLSIYKVAIRMPTNKELQIKAIRPLHNIVFN